VFRYGSHRPLPNHRFPAGVDGHWFWCNHESLIGRCQYSIRCHTCVHNHTPFSGIRHIRWPHLRITPDATIPVLAILRIDRRTVTESHRDVDHRYTDGHHHDTKQPLTMCTMERYRSGTVPAGSMDCEPDGETEPSDLQTGHYFHPRYSVKGCLWQIDVLQTMASLTALNGSPTSIGFLPSGISDPSILCPSYAIRWSPNIHPTRWRHTTAKRYR